MGSTKLLITIIDWRNSTSTQRTKTQISLMLAFRFIPGMSGMDVKQIVLELRIKGLPLAKLVLLDSGILPSLPHGWQWPWVPSNWQWNQDCSGQLVEKGLSSLPSAEKWGPPCIDEVLTGETSAPLRHCLNCFWWLMWFFWGPSENKTTRNSTVWAVEFPICLYKLTKTHKFN